MTSFHSRATAGFTLVELVLIILIVSVLSVVVAIQWPGTTSISAGGMADQMASDLRYAQTLAMTRDQRFCFLITGNTYQILASASGAATSLAYGSSVNLASGGLTINSVSPANMFVFDGQGIPYSSGATTCNTANANAATALSALASIVLTDGSQTRSIYITPQTGWVFFQ